MTRASEAASTPHVRGNTGEAARGSYCTPKYVADALGPLDLDPFSNARSHVRATLACWLERGDNGFGPSSAVPGEYTLAIEPVELSERMSVVAQSHVATANTRSWLQPDYVRDFVLRAIRHYVHTRYVALLRFDPRPEWNSLIGEASEWIGVLSNSPGRSSFEFEFPPGFEGAGNTFPHALYARSYEDVTPEMRRLCCYPDGSARHWRKRSALADPASISAFAARWGFDAARFTAHP